MSKYIMVTTTFEDKKEAMEMANFLLEKRLVSCCQLSNITSTYHWEGKLECADEYLLQMKTKKSLFSEIEKIVLKNHSYELPQLIAYDITEASKDYLHWIDQETISDSIKSI